MSPWESVATSSGGTERTGASTCHRVGSLQVAFGAGISGKSVESFEWVFFERAISFPPEEENLQATVREPGVGVTILVNGRIDHSWNSRPFSEFRYYSYSFYLLCVDK